MQLFKLGTQRQIELYNEKEIEELVLEEYDFLYNSSEIKSYFHAAPFKVIGAVNKGHFY